VIYFVTFAMHFIPAARILDSEPVAIFAMLVAASGAVGFSLRYASEWTTTFAFFLIYMALGLAGWKTDASFNLVSTAIVAAGLSLLAWIKGWERLLTLGIFATWLVLAAWIVPSVWSPGAIVRGSVLSLWAFSIAHSVGHRVGNVPSSRAMASSPKRDSPDLACHRVSCQQLRRLLRGHVLDPHLGA